MFVNCCVRVLREQEVHRLIHWSFYLVWITMGNDRGDKATKVNTDIFLLLILSVCRMLFGLSLPLIEFSFLFLSMQVLTHQTQPRRERVSLLYKLWNIKWIILYV